MSHPLPTPAASPAPTPAPARRRSIAALAAASLAGACGLTAAAFSATAHATGAPASLAYHVGSSGSDMIEPWFTVTNTGGAALSLSTVKIRYYFTADSVSSYQFACEWAQVGCGNITGTVGTLASPTATADHYLEVGFTGGTLAPGASTGDLQLRLNAAGWASVNQRNDYSFNAAQTAYGPSSTITLAVNGAIVSGTAPGGNPTSPSTSPSSSPSTSPSSSPSTGGGGSPSGVLFDDFSYTGPSDPNLNAHGWAIRTGSGGPGVQNTWTADTFTFPADSTAKGGHVMNLKASTDGTTAGTKQAEIDTTAQKFFEGTYAARVYFNDAPTTGANGDHVNETFYTITPDNSLYSENDFEYLPNGGWGGPANSMYTTTWYSADAMDRVTNDAIGSLQGWHTLVATVYGGTVTYYIDGKQVFSSTGKYYPRQPMTIDFNEWFIDLPFNGARTWDEKVNWVYFAKGVAQSPAAVQSAVDGYYSGGTHFKDTVPAS
ncbi:cellulose binding domain-containing protein [Catenulispora yoronensis]|uniref:Cellulose binding domain-containing protein n=1 Tax=Catenulispora yoronensis TaxID=450799 RepID=A0ABP5F6T2_9ACTN